MSASSPDLPTILGTVSSKSRTALEEAFQDADAWLEGISSGARSVDEECVICGRGPPLEHNHVAGKKHGELTVPMCIPHHQRFTEEQDLWPPGSLSEERDPDLDLSLLLLGLRLLLRLRAQAVNEAASGAYVALGESLREQYLWVARRLK